MTSSKLGWAGQLGLVTGAIAILVALTLGAPVAQAAPSSTGRAAVVIYRHWRSPVGVMLTNTKGRSLYIHRVASAPGAASRRGRLC